MEINCDDKGIEKIVQVIEKGGIVIFPTDTVYGIGCNPYNENSVKKIYQIKSRTKLKALPVLAYSLDIVKKIALIDQFTEKIIEKYWPGPLTLILTLTDEKLKKEIDGRKTEKEKKKYKEILEAGMKILRPNRKNLYFAIASYITLQTAKSMLLSKLNGIQSIGSFMRTGNGYKVTSPEGYVAINKGSAVKLVDRLVFSQANFNVAKDWVKG